MRIERLLAAVAALGIFAGAAAGAPEPECFGAEDFGGYAQTTLIDLAAASPLWNSLGSWKTGADDRSRISVRSPGTDNLCLRLDTNGSTVTNEFAMQQQIGEAIEQPGNSLLFEINAVIVPNDGAPGRFPDRPDANGPLKFALYSVQSPLEAGGMATNLVLYHAYSIGDEVFCTNETVSASMPLDFSDPERFHSVKAVMKKAGSQKMYFSMTVDGLQLFAPMGCLETELETGIPGSGDLENRIWFQTANSSGMHAVSTLNLSGRGAVDDIKLGLDAYEAPEPVTVTWTADEKLAAWEDPGFETRISTSGYMGLPGSKIYFTLAPGYEEGYEITGTDIVYDGETGSYVHTLSADAALDVAASPVPIAITVVKAAVGGDAKGMVALPDGQIMSETDTEVAISASAGYRIGQVVVSGKAVPGLFGLASTNVTVRFTADNPAISATFVKENAWFLDPAVRDVFFLAGNTYNPSYMAMTEDETDLFVGITRTQGDECNRGIFQFDAAMAANTLDPGFKPVNATTRPLNVQYETQGSVFASKAAGVVVAGGNYGSTADLRDRSIAYPLGGEWGDPAYGATKDDRTVLMTDMPLKWQRLAPATFNGDGTRVYGNAYYDRNIYEFAVMKDASGAVTNLLTTGRMWRVDSSRATAMAYAEVGGSKNVYVANQGKIYMFREEAPFVRTENSQWATNSLDLVGDVGFTATQLYVTGKADGTPRLVAGSANDVKIWDLNEDGTALRSETPMVHHILGDYTPSSNNRGLAVLDDDTRAFVNHMSGVVEMSVTVLEKKPENVIVRATFGQESEAMDDVLVARGGAFSNTYSAPKDKYIKDVFVNGARDADFTPACYVYSGENLERHVYIAISLEDVKYSVSWQGSENVTVAHGSQILSGTSGSFKAGDRLVFRANSGYAITSVTAGGGSAAFTEDEYVYIVGSGDGQSVVVVATEATSPYEYPEGGEIADEALIAWLEGKDATNEEIASLGSRAKLMEKYLLNLDLAGSSYELKVGAIRAAGGEVEITVELLRENATGEVTLPINGRLRLYGADALGAGVFSDEGVIEIENGDFSRGREAVKRFSSTKKFFKAVIE